MLSKKLSPDCFFLEGWKEGSHADHAQQLLLAQNLGMTPGGVQETPRNGIEPGSVMYKANAEPLYYLSLQPSPRPLGDINMCCHSSVLCESGVRV